MISNQILQNTIDGLKGITRTDLCVIDVEGNILAATFPEADKFVVPAQEFVGSPADSQVVAGCQFFKVFDEHQLEYILLAYGDTEDVYMIGKMAVFQIQNLLVAYKERFDKDNFIKNLILDNLLLVDIYNRAKKLHIETEVRRVVFLVETNREKDGNELEKIRGLFGGKSKDFVTAVDEKDIITGADLKAHDVLIGMASSGVHSNGFSLVRKIFRMNEETLNTYIDELGTTLGEALLAPTRIYVKALKSIKDAGVRVKACSHITGGGFYENVPRMLPEGKHAVIEKNSYPIPPIFGLMAREGNVEEHMMYNTYNMGLGMVLAVDPADVDKTMEAIKAAGDTPYVVGKITDGEKGVTLC